MYHLGMALLPAFQHPERASRLFVESVTTAIGGHIAQRYGGMRLEEPRRGGLAAWQERVAVDMLQENLDGEVTLASIARRCQLSTSHFARAFRQSTGLPPHRWLLHRRIDRAKEALRDPLADVATTCGFADQSHFTRVFTKLVGVSPGEWRRRH
jgi:AraC-like DNA-binding protein